MLPVICTLRTPCTIRSAKLPASSGIISTIAGTGAQAADTEDGFATEAPLNRPTDVAVDDAGNVFVADSYNNRICRLSLPSSGTVLQGTARDAATGLSLRCYPVRHFLRHFIYGGQRR